MRSGVDAATMALWATGDAKLHVRLQVANGDATLIDLSHRLVEYSLAFPNPKTPVASLDLTLLKSVLPTDSLVPYDRTSSLNRLNDGVTYAPLLMMNRRVIFSIAFTDHTTPRPVNGSLLWYEVFRGVLRPVRWPDWDSRTLTVSCVDMAGVLQITKMEQEYRYASGTSIEDAIRQLLDNNGWDSVDMYVPVPTGKVLEYDYAPGLQKTVWSQVWALAQSIGWLIWFRYRGNNTLELVLFAPKRFKTVPDTTIPKLFDFKRLEFDPEQVAWVGYLIYIASDGAPRVIGPLVNGASQAKYGGQDQIRQVFWIVLTIESPVRTEDAAVAMLGDAMSDVSDPELSASAQLPPMPFIECGEDLLFFPAQKRFFSDDELLAPFANSLQGGPGEDTPSSSTMELLGAPSAGTAWFASNGKIPVPPETFFAISHLEEISEEETDTTKTMGWVLGEGSFETWGAYLIFNGGDRTEERVSQVAEIAEAGAVVSVGPVGRMVVEAPGPGQVGIGYLVPKMLAAGVPLTPPIRNAAQTFVHVGPVPDIVRESIVGEDTLEIVPLAPTPLIQKVSFSKRVGGQPGWSAWEDQLGPTYSATVDLDPKHSSEIAYRVYVDGSIAQERVVTGFDPGPQSNVSSANTAEDGTISKVTVHFDTDTVTGPAAAEYRVDGGSVLTVDVDIKRISRFDVSRSTVATKIVEVRGYNEVGDPGDWYPIEVSRIADTGTSGIGVAVGLQVDNRWDCENGGVNRADYWLVDSATPGANDVDHRLQFIFYIDGAEVETQNDILPSAGGTTAYSDTFGFAPIRSHKVRMTVYETGSLKALASVESLSFDNTVDETECP